MTKILLYPCPGSSRKTTVMMPRGIIYLMNTFKNTIALQFMRSSNFKISIVFYNLYLEQKKEKLQKSAEPQLSWYLEISVICWIHVKFNKAWNCTCLEKYIFGSLCCRKSRYILSFWALVWSSKRNWRDSKIMNCWFTFSTCPIHYLNTATLWNILSQEPQISWIHHSLTGIKSPRIPLNGTGQIFWVLVDFLTSKLMRVTWISLSSKLMENSSTLNKCFRESTDLAKTADKVNNPLCHKSKNAF